MAFLAMRLFCVTPYPITALRRFCVAPLPIFFADLLDIVCAGYYLDPVTTLHSMSYNYKGTTPNHGSYKAQLLRRGKLFYLGTYKEETEAAKAYDRGVFLTEPWTTKRQALNFQDSTKPPESDINEYEQNMLIFLRTHYPEAEKNHKIRVSVEDETPDGILNDLSGILERTAGLQSLLSDFRTGANRAIHRMAVDNAELKQLNQWYKERLEATEAELAKLKLTRGPDGKRNFAFTPVKPAAKIAVPPAKPAVAELPAPAPVEVPGPAPLPPAVPLSEETDDAGTAAPLESIELPNSLDGLDGSGPFVKG